MGTLHRGVDACFRTHQWEKERWKEELELSKEKKVGRCFYPGADQRFGFKDGSSIISTHTATHENLYP